LTINETPVDQLPELAQSIRVHALRMTSHANASHIGSGFSMADILAVLYGRVLKVDPQNPDWKERDRFVLSKGHGAATLYATLAESGFFPIDWLQYYSDDNQALAGHVAKTGVPGVELATGSLGHGLPVALGMAIACRADALSSRVIALLSDGELNEGSNWEAIMLAGHLKCRNLTVVIDANAIQSFGRVSDILDLEPLADKWRAFGWHVTEVDGHDHAALHSALTVGNSHKPGVILARTIKGKGVSFMENKLEWHYRSASGENLEKALTELGEDS
jgi:transketolase